ncbi:Ig-like domain-containing protein [Myxococcus xanthus]|uniref:Ig-like domain-containing protein n=1 Tax=Myxococcus xanthus TaxID=34 RepID=UPI001CEC2C2A|nr:Ig-like domain-containing protein [Myxococcus xanthus]
MNPRRTRARWALRLLYVALGTAACDDVKSEPLPPAPPIVEPPPELRVTAHTEGPEFCREGLWTLSVSVEGGTPERVELLTNGETPTRLAAPYQHVVDCAAHAEGSFAFIARAVAGNRKFDAEAGSVTVDRTPPTVVAVRPGHSQPSVSSPMGFVFSEPLLPGSLQSAPAELIGEAGLPVAHQAVLSEDGTVLELVPTSLPQPPVTMSAMLIQLDMTDRAGNPLDPILPDFAHLHHATYWPFGRVMASPGSWATSLALESGDAGTVPVVGFIHDDAQGTGEPTVARWNGDEWQHLPPLRAANARSASVSGLQVAQKDDALVAAWRERDATTGGARLHVASYTGTAWQPLGAPYDIQSESTQVKLALEQQGRPVIALERNVSDSDTEVRVIRWTGTEWRALGGLLDEHPVPNTPARRAAIATDDTRVLVSWVEPAVDLNPPRSDIHVRAFENGNWVPVGASIPVAGYASVESIVLAIQPDSRAVIAWSEAETSASVNTLRFSSAALDSSQPTWASPEYVDTQLGSGRYASLQLVVGHDNEPWLAWTEYRRYFPEPHSYYRRRPATGWEPKQLIAGEPVWKFLLDEDGHPWALSGDAVVRPQ